jgi:PAS domain S-box-containing protein
MEELLMTKKPTYEELEQRVDKLEKESRDRKRLDERLRLLSLTIEQSSEGIAMSDLDGNIEYLNDAFANMHGYSPEELVGKHLSTFHTPDNMPSVETAKRQVKETGSYKGEIWHVRRNGTVFPTFMHNSLLRDEAGNPIGMIGTLRDISDLKAKEGEIRASEIRYRELFNNISSGVAIYEAKDNGNNFFFKDFNRAAERIENTNKEDLIGKSVLEVFPWVKEFGLFDVFKRVWETGDPEDFPISLYKDQRIAGWRENYVYKLPSGEIVAVYDDITKLKRSQEALQDSRNMLQTVLDSIPSAVFWKDRDSIYLGGNRTWLEATGLKSSEEVVGKSDYDLPWEKGQADTFREDDRRVMESGIPEYDIIEPYLQTDGTQAWAKTNKVPLRDKEGNVTGVLGTYEDITERKQAEAALRESELRLHHLSSRLISAQEEERKRISLELHDEMGQALTAMGLNLESIGKELAPEHAAMIKDKLAETISLVEQASDRVRDLSLDLRPSMLDDLGLLPTLRWYINSYEKRTETPVIFEAVNLGERLAPEVEIALYRIVQESLNNITKHARAKKVKIRLEQKKKKVVVLIKDDGIGFHPDRVVSETIPVKGIGLLGMQERVRLLGGSFRIRSHKGQGTSIFVELTLH